MKKVLALIALFTFLHAAETDTPNKNKTEIRIIAADPTPEPDHVVTRIVFPEDMEMKQSNPINMEIKLEGFPLGIDSNFPRKKEIYNDEEGQCLHVFIDDRPYFCVNQPLFDSTDDLQDYFDQVLEFELPFNLESGMHVVRAFPTRSYNESLKGDGCFAASIFFLKNQKNPLDMDLTKPYLTYHEPQGRYPFSSKPLLLDFYLTHCTLSKDGYKVRVTIDDSVQRILTQWVPYYIYGLKKGNHKVRLELLDRQNLVVKGPFNNVERIITLY